MGGCRCEANDLAVHDRAVDVDDSYVGVMFCSCGHIIHGRYASRSFGCGTDEVRRATTNIDEAKYRRATGDVTLCSCSATAITDTVFRRHLTQEHRPQDSQRTRQHDRNNFPSHRCSLQHHRTLRTHSPQAPIRRSTARTRSEQALSECHPRQYTSSAEALPHPHEPP